MAPGTKAKRRKAIAFAALITAAVILLFLFFLRKEGKKPLPLPASDEELIYAVFDQGQGLSVLISQGDMQILIDGGPYENGASLSEKIGTYAKDGIIEYVIATHCHADHVGGLQYVYEAFDVEHTIYGDLAEGQGYFWYFENAVREDGGTFEEDSEMSIELPGGAVLDIYDIEDGNEEPNNNSVVTYLRYGSTSFLCTGDLEREMEERLKSYDLKPTVVVAGHHGSSDANSLLKDLRPGFFIVSAAKKNPNYQPHRSVLRDAIYYTNGKNVYGTWRSGDIVFISSGKGVKTNLSRWDRLSADDAGAPR
ncbi:MAG: MBL fold metallo-hydrolase [Firmicutes bacterium]|nr:MBL fold metallo-hydrolase [Bacillota bacterium]